jgi:hypothetical protein
MAVFGERRDSTTEYPWFCWVVIYDMMRDQRFRNNGTLARFLCPASTYGAGSIQQHPFAGMDDAIEGQHEKRLRERARFLKNGKLCGLHSVSLELRNWA